MSLINFVPTSKTQHRPFLIVHRDFEPLHQVTSGATSPARFCSTNTATFGKCKNNRQRLKETRIAFFASQLHHFLGSSKEVSGLLQTARNYLPPTFIEVMWVMRSGPPNSFVDQHGSKFHLLVILFLIESLHCPKMWL